MKSPGGYQAEMTGRLAGPMQIRPPGALNSPTDRPHVAAGHFRPVMRSHRAGQVSLERRAPLGPARPLINAHRLEAFNFRSALARRIRAHSGRAGRAYRQYVGISWAPPINWAPQGMRPGCG